MSDGQLYKEFITEWKGEIGVPDMKRAVAWNKFKKSKNSYFPFVFSFMSRKTVSPKRIA